jgi:hypothetical protein
VVRVEGIANLSPSRYSSCRLVSAGSADVPSAQRAKAQVFNSDRATIKALFALRAHCGRDVRAPGARLTRSIKLFV